MQFEVNTDVITIQQLCDKLQTEKKYLLDINGIDVKVCPHFELMALLRQDSQAVQMWKESKNVSPYLHYQEMNKRPKIQQLLFWRL